MLTWTAGRLHAAEDSGVTVWRIEAVRSVGGHVTEALGAPRVVENAVAFDGLKDGLLVPDNPLTGLKAFTLEVLFKPEAGGPAEQRFWHAQDAVGARALLETRLDGKGAWWLDAFLFQPGKTGRALIDATKTHPTGAWYWVGLRYDGKTMTSFVDGVTELQGEVEFGPMGAGKLSLGVRQNLVYWFKGAIREMRVTPAALPEEKLQRAK